jgi:hypothetical protein
MLRGRFGDTSGRPYIEGRLILSNLNIFGDISFLVDTGSDETRLHPSDGIRLNIDYGQLSGDVESVGTSGVSHDFTEPALVVFSEPKRFLYVYNITLRIAPYDVEIVDLPSLLGRNILDRWRMIYDPQKKRLVFKVISADVTVPLS